MHTHKDVSPTYSGRIEQQTIHGVLAFALAWKLCLGVIQKMSVTVKGSARIGSLRRRSAELAFLKISTGPVPGGALNVQKRGTIWIPFRGSLWIPAEGRPGQLAGLFTLFRATGLPQGSRKVIPERVANGAKNEPGMCLELDHFWDSFSQVLPSAATRRE